MDQLLRDFLEKINPQLNPLFDFLYLPPSHNIINNIMDQLLRDFLEKINPQLNPLFRSFLEKSLRRVLQESNLLVLK